MNWTELLKQQIEGEYKATLGLMDLLDDEALSWKPATGENWMTTGQLLLHVAMACGAACRGFVTGDWGMPEGVKVEDLTPEEMLPPAEKMPAVESVAKAKELLLEDKQVALELIAQVGEEKLAEQAAPAPWDPSPLKLGHRLLQMVEHLAQHKAQLFYYLKLQGKPVNTINLHAM